MNEHNVIDALDKSVLNRGTDSIVELTNDRDGG